MCDGSDVYYTLSLLLLLPLVFYSLVLSLLQLSLLLLMLSLIMEGDLFAHCAKTARTAALIRSYEVPSAF